MNKKILLIGGGGHCKSVLDSLLESDEYLEVGIIDKRNIGKSILGIPIIGCDDDLPALYKEGYHYAFITVGNSGDSSIRENLFNLLKQIGFMIPNIIDSTAVISKYIEIEEGSFIGKNVVVNAGSFIGKCSIINSGSIIEHDCIICKFSNISPGVVLCGEVEVGSNANIGAGSVVKQQVRVGSNSIVGMGSMVLKNINDNILAYGNPCKEVKSI